jgi:hypothetical protein
MSYTKPISEGLNPTNDEQTTFTGKCQALRTALFPNPPKPPEGTEFVKSKANIGENRQVKISKGYKCSWGSPQSRNSDPRVVTRQSKKTPGPDGITQEIISKTFQAIPNVLIKIRSSLIDNVYHYKGWRQATGAILPKPGKRDYSILRPIGSSRS